MNATQEELVEAEGIGPERAEALAEWFRDDDNRRLVEELRELGLRFEIGDEEKPVEGPLTGNDVRDHRHARALHARRGAARLEALGAKVSDSVSSKTTGLIVGEEPGQVEADEGREGRRAAADRGRPARATGPDRHNVAASPERRLAPSRSDPARGAPTTTRCGQPFCRIEKT